MRENEWFYHIQCHIDVNEQNKANQDLLFLLSFCLAILEFSKAVSESLGAGFY